MTNIKIRKNFILCGGFMKKTLQKIITIALIGGCLTSSLFAEKGRDFKNTGKPHIEHKMMPGLMKFEELKGVVKVEEKDNAKKIYVYTSANKRVLVETVRKFDYEKKPYKNFDKKDFPKKNNKEFSKDKGKRKDFPKMSDKEYSKDNGKDFPKMDSKEYSKDSNKDFPKMNDKEYSKDNKKDYPKMNGKEFDKDKFKDFSKYKDKDFDKFDKKCPYYSKNSAIEELMSLNGKLVTLIGKYNESKDTFYVCGMLEK